MAINSPDIGGAVGGMQAIAEGGGMGAVGKLGAEGLGSVANTGFEGMAANLGPEISTDFTSGLDKTLDANPNAGIKDIAKFDLKDADVKSAGSETPTAPATTAPAETPAGELVT